MKFNKIFYSLGAGALAAAAFISCDDIKEDERFLPYERPTVVRKVLIQEFSGMMCTNCPNGAEEIHNLQLANPGQVVAVAMHTENNNLATPLNGLDLRNEVSTAYYNHYGVKNLPTAVISGQKSEDPTTWGSLAMETLLPDDPSLDPVVAGITLSPRYDAATRELTVDYDIDFLLQVSEECTMQLWVVENDIHGWQMTKTGLNRDYTHNHILRAAVNGTWGESIGSSFNPETPYHGTSSIKLDESWVAENCNVVGVLFYTNGRMPKQAEEVSVIAK